MCDLMSTTTFFVLQTDYVLSVANNRLDEFLRDEYPQVLSCPSITNVDDVSVLCILVHVNLVIS